MAMYPLDEYRREVDALPAGTDAELIGFIPQAARLAALPGGGAEQFLRWPRLAEAIRTPFSTLLRQRVREGLWDIDEAVGENLGIAIINAQDFASFASLAQELTPEAADRLLSDDAMNDLRMWAEEAEDAALDAEAVSFIVDWAEMFPIREELRLRIVGTPFSAFEERVMAMVTEPLPLDVERHTIAELLERADNVSSLKAADGVAPSQTLMELIELDKEIQSPWHGTLFLTRRLDASWRLRLDVEQEVNGGEDAYPLEALQCGIWPAKRQSTGGWIIELRNFSQECRLSVLRSPIWIVPEQGPHLCLQ